MKRLLFCALVAISFSRPVAAALKPRIAYLGSVARDVDAEARDAVDSAAIAGIQGTQAIYVALGEGTAPRAGADACTTPDCVARVKQKSGADYFVVADVRATLGGADHAVTMQLIRGGQPAEVVMFESFSCEGCIPAKLGERVEANTAQLISRLIESLDNKPVAGPPSAPAIVSEGPPHQDVDRTWPAWTAWTAAGIGVAGIASGAWLYHLDGRGTCGTPTPPREKCPETYGTKGWGIGALAVGGLALAGTIYVVYHNASSSSASVAFTGDGFVVSGRF